MLLLQSSLMDFLTFITKYFGSGFEKIAVCNSFNNDNLVHFLIGSASYNKLIHSSSDDGGLRDFNQRKERL